MHGPFFRAFPVFPELVGSLIEIASYTLMLAIVCSTRTRATYVYLVGKAFQKQCSNFITSSFVSIGIMLKENHFIK